MKRFFFLPSYISYPLVGMILFSFWKYSFVLALFISLILSFFLMAYRRAKVPFVETSKSDGEIYLSPIYGQIISIRQHVPILDGAEIGHEIRISLSYPDSKGIYLPTSGEVTYLKANKGRKISRSSDIQAFYGSMEEVAHTNLGLTSKNNTQTFLRFVDSPFGRRPSIWLKSGDRGRGAACFGYYPFGGTLFIYLPKNSDILVFESERVIPGQTVIASIKDL